MPDFMQSPFDGLGESRPQKDGTSNSIGDGVNAPSTPDLPSSGRGAIWRGVRGLCPRCGKARLFKRFLTSTDECALCGQNWALHQADDFPAYVAILLTGHIMAPVIIAFVQEGTLSLLWLCIIIVSTMLTLMTAFLQPAKGAIIALQWWFGMHGFEIERREGTN